MADFNCFLIDLKASEQDDLDNLRKICTSLFNENHFCDVILSCKDGQIQAHRMILSSASTYLYNLFTSTPWPTPCSFPIILLKNSNVEDVRSVMEFIYTGTTKISKDKVQAIMDIGRELECSLLMKAIDVAVQNCGIAMFRKLISNNNSTRNSNNNPSSSQSKTVIGNMTLPPVIKSEPLDAEEEQQKNSQDKYPLSVLQNPTTVKNSDIIKNEKYKLASINKFSSTGLNSKRNNDIFYKNLIMENTNSDITIERSKVENFIYTNKDFAMDFTDEIEDEDNNKETENKHASIISNTNTIGNNSFLNNRISISSIPHYMLKANSKNEARLNSSVKTEPQDDSNGVAASCPWCLQVFTSLTLLQRHIKTHVAVDKPKFICQYCNTKFARSAHLKRHERTHTGEKPYVCGICQMRFARQDKLKLHLERHLQNANNACNPNTSRTVTSYPPQNADGSNLPIKVLIPTNASKLSNSNFATNKFSTPNNSNNSGFQNSFPNIINESRVMTSPPSKLTAGIRLETVTKNLSPSTTITVSSTNSLLYNKN